MRQDWDACTNGMIMEFKDMTQAEAFAVAVREQFNLDSRVFANSVDAERVHLFPFQQHAPVVHVDRPSWTLPKDCSKAKKDAAWAKENKIVALAEKFGGVFIGT